MGFIHFLSSFLLLFVFSPLAFGKSDIIQHDLSTQIESSFENVDLASFLNTRSRQHDTIMTEALDLLESMKASPSCNRIAATKLVTSCQSIGEAAEKATPDVHLALDYVKSLYAARLALCELKGAGASIPTSCIPITVNKKQRKGLFGLSTKSNFQIDFSESTTPVALESCLKAMESRPQWWTSYSNSRQNAMIICQAARIETEKDELLELHRSIVDSTIKLNQGLQDALQRAAAESAQHDAFAKAVASMRSNLSREMGETESQLQRAMSSFIHDLESTVGSLVSSVAAVLRVVDLEAVVLQNDIRNATYELAFLSDTLRDINKAELERNEALMSVHQEGFEANNQLTTALRSSIQSILERDVTRLTQELGSFDTALDWLGGKLNLVIQQEVMISQRLQNVQTALEESETKAGSLLKAQSLQSEAIAAQSHAQDTLRLNTQIIQSLLDKAMATAANMQAIVEESTSKFHNAPGLQGLVGKFSVWTLCALLSGLVGAQNPRSSMLVLLISSIHFVLMNIL